MTQLTPFQTVGPFFEVAMPAPGRSPRVTDATEGRRIRVEGTVRDGAGAPVADGLIETWQADAEGCYPERPEGAAGFDGFGRLSTDAEGRFALSTILPGAVSGPTGDRQAPHIVVGVLARGILTRLVTRIYFEGDPANEDDPILGLVPPERRETLVARRLAADRFRFDIVLQGPGETVFFDV
jgi:protocatechuate 3,4-dioxygenase alpha subunit